MNLSQAFRESVEKVGGGVSDTFDLLCAKINAMWNIEHKDDGTHAAITADSITAETGTIETMSVEAVSVTGNATISGDLNVGGNANVTGSFGAASVLAPSVVASTVLANSSVTTGSLIGGGGTVAVTGGVTISSTLGVTGAAAAASLVTTGVVTSGTALTAGTTISERGRSTPVGEWITPSFNAGDYTGGGGWTVASGDRTTAAYTLVGKTMTYSTVLITTTVTGGAAVLSIAIPGGFTAAKAMRNACEVIDNGTRTTGRIAVSASGTTLDIQKTDATNWAASTDNTAVSAQLTFEVT